jgi:hypothetical protein
MTKSIPARFWIATTLLSSALGCGWADLGNDQSIGRRCELPVAAGANQGEYNVGASECPSKLCLKAPVQPGATPPIPTTGPTCSGECNRDSDCDGETRNPADPNDNRCAQGFMCGMPFEVGPLACRKLCVCKDSLSPAGAVTPISCQGTRPPPEPISSIAGDGEVTTAYITVVQKRLVDIVAMVDNSETMAPKVAKLNAAFPKLIEALRDPSDGTLPDLRVAILDSDLGTGCRYASGSCGPKHPADGSGCFGDQGLFQMRSTPTACSLLPGARFLEQRSGLPVSYSGDISSAFACLTSNLGTAGCFYEHSLQAFEFALAATGVGTEEQQATFLRSSAYLTLLFLTDHDDCSVATNYGLFGDLEGLPPPVTDLRFESARLRCATRGHQCGGQNLANSGPLYPTQNAYVHPFADCQARTDTCPNPTDGTGMTDTSQATTCSPFKNLQNLAAEIKHLKEDPDNQILVAGLFGWPMSDADMATAQYKIAPVPNPNPADTAHPAVFDVWPVCYDPNQLPAPATTDPATGFDATAAAWGATGGLREAAFVDQFGANGMKFSICEPDFNATMANIGAAISRKMQSLCFDYKLVDVDLVTPGVQADCRVVWRTLDPNSSPGAAAYVESPLSLPYCPPGAVNGAVDMDCWQITVDPNQCPVSGQLISVLRTADEVRSGPPLPAGTKVKMQCQTCPPISTGAADQAGCAY